MIFLETLMTENQASLLRQYWEDKAEERQSLQQNLLLNEREFISFCRDRGLLVSHVGSRSASKFCEYDWLKSDGTDHKRGHLFHPFRLYSVCQILANVGRPGTHEPLSGNEEIKVASAAWTATVDLAYILEPIYWPRITGLLTAAA